MRQAIRCLRGNEQEADVCVPSKYARVCEPVYVMDVCMKYVCEAVEGGSFFSSLCAKQAVKLCFKRSDRR